MINLDELKEGDLVVYRVSENGKNLFLEIGKDNEILLKHLKENNPQMIKRIYKKDSKENYKLVLKEKVVEK